MINELERRLAAAAARRPIAPIRGVSVSPVVSPAGVDEVEGDLAATAIIEITPGMDDGDSPQWPDAAAEVAFLSEQGAGFEMIVRSPSAAPRNGDVETESSEGANLPLPLLETLVDRIPADAREVLEELFRARFVSVKRVQKASFK